MKTALLHYWLTNMRGGENVLAEFCKLYPQADIFTHAYNPDMINEVITAHRVNTSFIGKLPRAKVDCQKYLPLMPTAIKQLDLNGYELILSSESGPIKGINKPTEATHICYCHTPMRYIWDMMLRYFGGWRRLALPKKTGRSARLMSGLRWCGPVWRALAR